MPALVVIQLMPGVMTDNPELALQQSGRKPWAFNKFLSTMNGIRPGVHVLFVRTTMPSGSPIGRQGAHPPEAVVHRMVLGEVVTSISEMASPFFAGSPHELWFELMEDRQFDPPVDLAGASAFLNDKLPGLGLDDGKLLSVLSNGRSAKVGMYFDGEPRLAAYFKDISPKPAPSSGGVAPGTTPAVIPSGPLADVADEFCERVEAAGLRFGGINGPLPRAFLAALITKRFVLLTGLAGSGKRRPARAAGGLIRLKTGSQREGCSTYSPCAAVPKCTGLAPRGRSGADASARIERPAYDGVGAPSPATVRPRYATRHSRCCIQRWRQVIAACGRHRVGRR